MGRIKDLNLDGAQSAFEIKQDQVEPNIQPIKVNNYPSLGVLTLLLLTGFLLSGEHINTTHQLNIPDIVFSTEGKLALSIICFAILIFDIRNFQHYRTRLRNKISKLENEVDFVWQSKRKLQEKTHVYSDHADKLKLFISDKLLEYIEYDEKFLHFKSIAAEVRHNGVISYDIVKTALQEAAKNETQNDLSLSDTHRFDSPNYARGDYQQALDAMKYLWDLLDLSTADNIALHLGNYLIECEEHYYQLELQRGEDGDEESKVPYKPYFSPSYAAIKTIGPFLSSEQMDEMISNIDKRVETDPSTLQQIDSYSQHYETPEFRVNLSFTDHLLGNENHLILLLENLIKNAQYFSTKNRYKQSTDRIALQLHQGEGFIQYVVYNRGPHIQKDDKEKIFQLGFSTRRAKEHHGKGLGLFFVNEIVKGYQGKIQIENVYNQEHTYSIRIVLSNQEVVTKVIEVRMENKRPKARETNQSDAVEVALSEVLKWKFTHCVESIEISSTTSTQTHTFNEIANKEKTQILDPEHPYTPHWSIEISPHKKDNLVALRILDISGVKFSVLLPTAEARLNGDEPEFNENFSDEVERLNQQFKEYDDF